MVKDLQALVVRSEVVLPLQPFGVLLEVVKVAKRGDRVYIPIQFAVYVKCEPQPPCIGSNLG